jgi:hypothetical protein
MYYNQRKENVMAISERSLRRWRIDALKYHVNTETALTKHGLEMSERILRLTQELLDQHLVRKGNERWQTVDLMKNT